MTAVTMIFEMTRDYNIVLPMILAVALSVGVRRVLSPESIYTLKIYRRGHVLPKSLHANMFLVRRARDVMDTDVTPAPAQMSLEAFLAQPEQRDHPRSIVVCDGERLFGVLQVNASLREASQAAETPPTLRDIASQRYTIVHENDIVFDVIRRMWRRHSAVALVVRTAANPKAQDVLGVITKEQVADSVAASVNVYAGGN